MARYHLNWKGEAGLCKASKQCPFGGEDDHFPDAATARQAFEANMAAQVNAPLKKSNPQNKRGVALKTLTSGGKTYEVKDGKYGLYVSDGTVNAPLKGFKDAASVELADAEQAFVNRENYLKAKAERGAPSSAKVAKKVAPVSWKTFTPVAVEDSKIIAKPRINDNEGYLGGRRWVGGKYPEEGYLSQKDAAKAMRSDIREAIKAGELPKDLDYSVRMNTGSMVSSIDIILGEKNEAGRGVEVHELNEGDARLLGVKRYLEALGNQYSTDESNAMVDYFNSHNRARVRFRSKWD